jgi:hypothetical protein
MPYFVSRSTDKLSIIVPRQFDPFLFAFFPLWTVLWMSSAIKGYRSGVYQSASSFLALILFGVGTVLALYAWLWNLSGREELNFTVAGLQHRHVLFGLSRTREFRMNRIAESHFVESMRRARSRVPSGLGFRYKSEQVRIGDNLTQQEAREIIQLVTKQFPQVAGVWDHYAEGLSEPDELVILNLR